MNDSSRKSLMIVVERAVRPLRAGETRKLRIREELLAHLNAIFEEEYSRSGDEQAAVEQARRRFGDARELSKELQEAVPWWEWIPYVMGLQNYQPGEFLLHYAKRTMLYCTTMIGIIISLCLPIALVRGRSSDISFKLYLLLVVMPITTFMIMFVMTLFIASLQRALFAKKATRSLNRAVVYGLFSLCFFPLIAFTFSTLLTGDISFGLDHFRIACLFAPFSPPLFIFLARQAEQEYRKCAEWKMLEIEIDG